ncbi:hypothetical protein IWX78_000678 [Mycetocola sp. CAN_C7]|uniref:hypothetical protein n=1 Tax=Mycetocola sp. CAN_C7 TaxID=2787724 RepID=UPI0018CAAB67
MSDQISDDNPATDGVTSEGGVWGVGDPKDEDMLAKETVANDAVAGEPVEPSDQDGQHDAPFLDVDEADVETSVGNDAQENTHGEVEPGTDNQDTTVSQLTDALDSDALASSDAPGTDASGSER